MEEECTPDTVMDLVCLTMAQSIKTEVQTSLIVVGTSHFVKEEAFQTLHCNVFFSLFLRTPLVTCSVNIPLTYPVLVVIRSSHVGYAMLGVLRGGDAVASCMETKNQKHQHVYAQTEPHEKLANVETASKNLTSPKRPLPAKELNDITSAETRKAVPDHSLFSPRWFVPRIQFFRQ